ncbi:PDZ domain (Also known as DHR or GLGF) [Novipirellula galeiformis]|uniref:PDZ domain (Also known as DHR or GLGF) n=1 Tax=Novipirellula galeiformis TaxID=2528004 RepID=A0A5C6CU06_9BACT|nr:PDZ domain-containing protein [Novipirellula galeiformis]TWU26219.1 PDZ domain (Also known as DHR or GLGF) [Novipirellula galeiformis]
MNYIPFRFVPLFLVSMSWNLPAVAQNEAPADPNTQNEPQTESNATPYNREAKPLSYWVEQLNSDQFHRRKLATQQLIDAGSDAVSPLVAALKDGDLETVERAVHALRAIALKQAPNDEGGAWGELQLLRNHGAGSRAALAQAAVEEIHDVRGTQAKEALVRAGVSIGVDEFLVRAISTPQIVVQIDEQWNGDVEPLQWLRWIQSIEYARVKGPAVRADVLRFLVTMPDLKTIAVVEGTVDAETLKPLQEMKHVNSLEFRYVKLTPELGDEIAKIPMRISLNLMGTGISKEKVEALRQQLPGLTIDHRQGGFLGVSCINGFDVCRINEVIAGSAAEKSGLRRGDEIIQIDETEIGKFEDLQNAVNQKMPGDDIQVKFRRGDATETVKLKLGKLNQR